METILLYVLALFYPLVPFYPINHLPFPGLPDQYLVSIITYIIKLSLSSTGR